MSQELPNKINAALLFERISAEIKMRKESRECDQHTFDRTIRVLESQLCIAQKDFVHGWIPSDAGLPSTLVEMMIGVALEIQRAAAAKQAAHDQWLAEQDAKGGE